MEEGKFYRRMCNRLLQAGASHSFHFQQPLPEVPLAGKDPVHAIRQNGKLSDSILPNYRYHSKSSLLGHFL